MCDSWLHSLLSICAQDIPIPVPSSLSINSQALYSSYIFKRRLLPQNGTSRPRQVKGVLLNPFASVKGVAEEVAVHQHDYPIEPCSSHLAIPPLERFDQAAPGVGEIRLVQSLEGGWVWRNG